ncbi:hypothetical protein [Tritonibacter mobilis]|jgi:hypothetical protein|uniref:hypothetical protein n=1 Tax=Tritonibacter mobilis TaxID=379347 RepID=UPI000806E748|nr:hypothetical protein [Tritonibacter mobilis]GLP88664.1 hypothetical protein GCM10007921_42270 [Tritonibacter mobilis]SDX75423.1 hypothetical protein SAMN05444385_11286 [Tritonibacter mobilis]
MLKFKSRIVLACLSLVFTASFASAETWVCEFNDSTRRGTIPQKVVFELRPDGSALVMDPYLVHTDQAPKLAKFVKNTSSKLRVRWRVDDMPFNGGLASDMDFSLVHDKARNKAFITLNLPSFDNRDSGTGSCEVAK